MTPLLLSLTLAASAFEPSTAPSTGIVNGETEYGFPAAVSLGAGSGEYTFSACSASIITPRIVLSAAHCGADLPLETVVALGKAYFGTDVTDPDDTRGFVDLAVHPDYEELESGIGGTDLGAYDVAILVLDDDAPVTPMRINLSALDEDDVGLEMVSIGYGITSASSGTGSGTKRSAEMILDDVDEMFLYSRSENNPDEGQICSGDSGGPQVAQLDDTGEWVQVAVHSWGDQNCSIESGSTRVDVVWPWLMEQIEAEHGTADLCEINGRYADGTCDAWCDGLDPDCEPTDEPEDDTAKACSTLSMAGGPWVLALLALGWRRRSPSMG